MVDGIAMAFVTMVSMCVWYVACLSMYSLAFLSLSMCTHMCVCVCVCVCVQFSFLCFVFVVLQVCYGNAYGLVSPPDSGSNTNCDWSVDNQRFSAVYFSYNPDNSKNCHTFKDSTGSTYSPTIGAIFGE